jgi:protein-disulfide isomerase
MSPLIPPVSERDHVQGAETARVTLVEYGDYECPHCGAAHPVIKKLERHFRDRMRFVFRNFPLTQVHEHAEPAAEAAEAAAVDGKFWPMHDTIFEHQRALDDDDLVRYAERLGVPAEDVVEALERHKFAARISEDFMSGVRSGVNGTPTFFINGARYEGDYDLESLSEAIGDVLAGASG